MRSFFLFLLILLVPIIPLRAIEKRPVPLSLSVSIIVPCHPLHIHYLQALLENYRKQTVLPEEIVISISEQERVNLQEIKQLKNFPWPFKLKILLSPQRLFAGANRNVACRAASGDLFICQDADDTPVPERVELIKTIFSHYTISHLLHSYTGGTFSSRYTLENTNVFPLRSAGEAFNFEFNVHFGQCAFLRGVFKQVQWREDICVGEDISFDEQVASRFSSSVLIDAKLLIANTSFLQGKVQNHTEYD